MRRTSAFVLIVLAASGCAGRAAPAATGTLGTTPSTHAAAPASHSAPAPVTSRPAPPATVTRTVTATPTSSAWPSPEDCVTYDPTHLTVHYEAGIFLVLDGSTEVARLQGDPSSDVGTQGLALAQRYRKHCFLGRNASEGDYIFDYWRSPTGAHTTIPDEEDACSSYDPTNLQLEDLGEGGGWRLKDHDHVLHLFADDADARGGLMVARMYHQICFIGVTTDSDLDQVSYFR